MGELYCVERAALDPADGVPGIWATFPISVWDVVSLELCKVYNSQVEQTRKQSNQKGHTEETEKDKQDRKEWKK